MAHSPKKKAAVVADLVLGMPQREAAEKHGVGKGTVAEWASELEIGQNRAETGHAPIRQTAFQEAFYKCLEEIAKSMVAFAEVCQEKDFIRSNPDGASQLSVRTTDFADRIMARARSQADEASPAD